jgi:DNA-binding response OmpR family regulator
MAGTILVADDDPHIREVVRFALDKAGFETVEAADGREALRAFGARKADLVVLDIGMPELDGLGVCRELRKSSDVPILFLSSHDSEVDRIVGLEIGGDDYVVKPFHLEELVARLRALLRRSGAHGADRVGDLVLDPVAHAISGGLATASVTPTEFRLLASLAARPGEVVRRRELVAAGWPGGAIVHDNTLDQYVARLRRKLREVSGQTAIATAHGVGYRLQ